MSDLDAWVDRHTERRYGLGKHNSLPAHEKALAASRLLQNSVYNFHENTTDKQGTSGSIFAARPASVVPKVSCCDVTSLYYNASDVVNAWKLLVSAATDAPLLSQHDAFLYDLVVCGVQALSNLALQLHSDVVDAISTTNLSMFDAKSAAFCPPRVVPIAYCKQRNLSCLENGWSRRSHGLNRLLPRKEYVPLLSVALVEPRG